MMKFQSGSRFENLKNIRYLYPVVFNYGVGDTSAGIKNMESAMAVFSVILGVVILFNVIIDLAFMSINHGNNPPDGV